MDYKSSWLCRIFGHKSRLTMGEYHRQIDFCKRCFLPTSHWLVQEMNKLKSTRV